MAPPLAYKKNFRVTPALQVFYSGGPVRLLPDGSHVACACGEEVKVVEVSSGTVFKTLEGDSELVTSLAVTPDGKSIFVASRSRQIKHWEIQSTICLRAWKAHESPIADMSVDPSGGLLATASADRSIFIWDVEGGYCTHAFRGHKGVVTSILFHPDVHRSLLFSGSDDATVRVWDLVMKKCVAVLDKHFSTITSLAVSTNHLSLLTAGRDKVVNVWSVHDYSLKATVPVFEAVEAVCIVPDGWLAPGSQNFNEEKFLSKKQKKTSGSSLRFFTVGERGLIRAWLADGAVCVYEQKTSDAMIGFDKEETKGGLVAASLTHSPEGLMCVTADQRLLFYELTQPHSQDIDFTLNKRLIGYNDEVTDLKFLGGDSLLAVSTNSEQVRLYDLTSMACTKELSGHTDTVLCLDSSMSSSGKLLLASGGKDHMLRLWDVETGSCLAIAAGHMAAIGAITFSKKDCTFIITGSNDRTIKLWNLEGALEGIFSEMPMKLSSQAVIAAHDKDINAVAVAPNNSLVCSGSQDRTARVFKLPELIPTVTLRGHKRGIWSVEFSPVDQCVVTASGDKTVRIWALTDGSCLKTFEGHVASVLKVIFLSRGTQLVSAGADGLVKLWSIRTTECINTFDEHNDKIWALAVSQNEVLATGGGDSVVNVWVDCTEADEEAAVKQEEEEALKDQDLANALADTDFVKAINLAFELRRPFKLLNVFTELSRQDREDQLMQKILKNLEKEHVHLLLKYIRDWNSKSKFCHTAQRILMSLFLVLPPKEIVKVPGIRELLEGIIPYSHRHFTRIDRLARSTYLLDYTLACMSVLLPPQEVLVDQGNRYQESQIETSCVTKSEEQHYASGQEEIFLKDNGLQLESKIAEIRNSTEDVLSKSIKRQIRAKKRKRDNRTQFQQLV
ncbi:hypothetical protein O6H91_06G145300 [Diphasiastrum complanatum]|uniref:Uncharacterized protein n=4 Tax=Diphasiastrum complanatum TaxID=34168 RepID=A0ACC2DK81_DIPCM|nr:hypothetical protein O6H91_06G145300 [Diphasiastrum complanatum]KAJ7554559.1 hypothetical protein O6H91_06G145300 [Diphasiastrum complanatum]KAJ7554560.1 hypothetical protein O6H91_06G145300 [Diphasiastrum complanatum]KAJ7554561.1 hypothetical protein O6H91_06G145300 [Diphasiastrum complanatum]